MPVMVISTVQRQQIFSYRSPYQFGLDYHANKKACITSALFDGFLARLSNYVRQTPSHKVLLFEDSASVHATIETQQEHGNIEVVSLSSYTASRIQPLDAGIIASI